VIDGGLVRAIHRLEFAGGRTRAQRGGHDVVPKARIVLKSAACDNQS
jgi:hypothetical protein